VSYQRVQRWIQVFGLVICILLASACTESPTTDTVSGVVLNPEGIPVANARVRLQSSTLMVHTDGHGRFTLTGLPVGHPVRLSAWKEGYYCALLADITPPQDALTISLRRYQSGDNRDYAWVPPTGPGSCYSCKPAVTQLWLDADAHSRSAQNPRFLSMYTGTDLSGRRSPLTRYTYTKDYGGFPLPPDLSLPYYGPGYKLDFPKTAGNCAACHVPGAALDDPYGIDPTLVTGVDTFGVHCDFCHKVAGVRLDADGLPASNLPGVLSMDIRRPFTDDPQRYQLFFGPFDDDNVPEEDTYLPLIEQSAFCAPCHFGVFWDTIVYNSYGEWLASPYSDPQTGQTCQDCHMPRPTLIDGLPLTNIAPDEGGVERDPLTIAAHTFPGASDSQLLQNAVSMWVEAYREGSRLVVTVTVTNDQTGHHVPTDSPLRHLILLVEATGPDGRTLTHLEGPQVPEWGGIGDPVQGNYAGLPGKAYARVLQELWTEQAPSAAYWNPTRVLSDNRLAAYSSDTSVYSFATPPTEPVQLHVRLFFRRAFRLLAQQKGWNDPDILMESVAFSIE
jgi:hypothetical protein